MNIDVPHNTRAIPDGTEPVVINSGNGGSEKCDDISPLSEATPARRVCGEDDDTPPAVINASSNKKASTALLFPSIRSNTAPIADDLYETLFWKDMIVMEHSRTFVIRLKV